MPIVVDERAFGSCVSSAVTGSPVTSSRSIDSATFYEVTYGYRSGKKTGENQTDERDVYNPPKGAGIAALLLYRKRFLERQMTKVMIDKSSVAPTHFVLSDMGNEFANYKFRARVTPNVLRYGPGTSFGTVYTNVVPSLVQYPKVDGSLQGGHFISDFMGFLGTKPQSSLAKTFGGTHGMTLSGAKLEGMQDIKILNPIQNHASVLTTLLEMVRGDVPGVLKQLREHINTISTLRVISAKGIKGAASAVGGTYLENVFGWAPIMRDINAAIQVLTTIDQLLFPPDSTRRNRSRVLVDRQNSITTSQPLTANGLLNPGGLNLSKPSITKNRDVSSGVTVMATGNVSTLHATQEKIDIRTTVRFQTSLVPTSANNGHLDRMHELLGLELTPKVIWDLLPWSWLVDWFANIGDVIENLSNIHTSNLILNYAYSTLYRQVECSSVTGRPALTSTVTGFRSWSGDVVTKYEAWQKVRLKASPYGFATALETLTGNQWAILVALGLARTR